MQLAETLSVPSSNHLIETSPGPNEVFFTLVYGLIQSMRLPISPQNPCGSSTERLYIAWYFVLSTQARLAHSAGTL